VILVVLGSLTCRPCSEVEFSDGDYRGSYALGFTNRQHDLALRVNPSHDLRVAELSDIQRASSLPTGQHVTQKPTTLHVAPLQSSN
jgi:hypothetical protein